MYIALYEGQLLDRHGSVLEIDLPTQDCLFSSVDQIHKAADKASIHPDELEIVEMTDDE